MSEGVCPLIAGDAPPSRSVCTNARQCISSGSLDIRHARRKFGGSSNVLEPVPETASEAPAGAVGGVPLPPLAEHAATETAPKITRPARNTDFTGTSWTQHDVSDP